MNPPVRFGRAAGSRPLPRPDDARGADVPQRPDGASPASGGSATTPSAAAPPPLTERQRVVGEAVDAWCARLLELGGESALADITLLGPAAIDLTAAHPSGIAQLFAGRTTLLSNLVREGISLTHARRRARTVLARADELAQRYGVAPTYLAIGIGTWTTLEPAAPTEPAPSADTTLSSEPTAEHGVSRLNGPHEPTNPVFGEGVTGEGVTGEGAATEGVAAEGVVGETAAVAADVETPVALPPDAPLPEPGAPPVVERTIRAPLLLRPVRLTARSEAEVDVVLEPSVEINPVLLRALRAVGVEFDGTALARETLTEHGFSPRAVLARLREIGERALTDFTFADHLVLGPFVHPGQVLVEDLETRRIALAGHDVVAALAGDPGALAAVTATLPPFVPGDRAPDAERGVGDLDPTQQHAIDAVASGAHVFIDAPPGADGAATVAGILADAAASGRHVLYVSGTRRAAQGVSEAMQAAGLGDLLLDLSADAQWRSRAGARLAAGAALRAPDVDDDAVRRLRADLVDTRARLSAYFTGLNTRRDPWGVSAHDALQALAALTSARVSPSTRVRLGAGTLRDLRGERREEAKAALEHAAGLGAFEVRPSDTPWFGAAITDDVTARASAERVTRLAERTLPQVRRTIADAAGQTGLERAQTLREWGEQLDMLDGVRGALDDFQPMVFERSAADLVAATASRQWRSEHNVQMRWRVRRRLRRQAKDMVRPGRAVADLHTALVHVQEQREVWRRHCAAGGWPRLPEGLAQAQAEYNAVAADVRALEAVLASTIEGARLFEAPLTDVEARCRRLAADATALETLPERTTALNVLRRMGLGALVDDLAERRVDGELVGAELELAWWASVFEEILRADPALAGYDGATLGALADHLRELDSAQVESLPAPVRGAVVGHLRRVLRESGGAADLLEDLAEEQVRDLREAVGRLGPLAGALRPCWLVSPMQVPQLLAPGQSVDLVVLDAAQHLPVEQAVSAISRARQVVIVGDSRRAALNAPGAPLGIVEALARVLPHVTLSADRVVREPALMAFLGEHGYADVIRPVPTPSTRPCVGLDVVEGFGLPLAGSDLVESPQTEVDRVVDLVVDHALSRPDESLVVLTLSMRHADRIREAVRTAVADSPAVRDFFAADRPEPFAVLELDSAAGVRRDAVILSLGLGKTPHGRVIHRFGRVSDPDGAALLIDAIDACRRRLTVVSCFRASDLDRRRLRTPGPALLADLLVAAEAGGAHPATIPAEGEPDSLLVDLAERLWQLGLTVNPRYGVPGGVRIPLVIGHPERPDELLLAVLTDDAEYVAQRCLRIRDRHDVRRLLDRGWGVHMAFSTAVFMDPQGEARQILAAVLELLAARRAHDAARGVVPMPVPVVAEEEGPDEDVLVAPEAAREVPDDAAPVRREDDGGGAGSRAGGGGAVVVESAEEAVAEEVAGEADSEADPEATQPAEAPVLEAPAAEEPTPARPDLEPGLPITSYSADDLDALAAWIVATDGLTEPEHVTARLREELGLTRRSARADAILDAVVARLPG